MFSSLSYSIERWGSLYLFLLFALFSPTFSQSSLEAAKTYYNRNLYEECLSVLKTEMKKPDFKPDKNFLLLFFLTEPEVKNLNAMLFELYSKGIKAEDTDFFFYILISMDKALVSGDFKPGIIWGDIFYKEAEHTRFYTEGIYLYSCLLFARKDYKSLNRIMDEILESEKKTPSVDKTLLLKSYKPENTFYLKRSFIKNSLKSRYRSLIFRNLIRFYRRQGKHKIATKLNKILLKIQKKELLEENIKKLSGVNMKM